MRYADDDEHPDITGEGCNGKTGGCVPKPLRPAGPDTQGPGADAPSTGPMPPMNHHGNPPGQAPLIADN
jgi:hypothetical protein